MMNLSRMWAVAGLTARLLVRSWRFWILAVLAMLLSAVIPVYYSVLRHFLSGFSGTTAVIHPSFVPYIAHLGISLALGLAVVWFAFDAPYRHRSTRSEEVLHASPIRTSELVVGDFIGILIPSSIVAALSAAISFAIQFAFKAGSPVIPHLVHLFLQSIPSLAATAAFTLCVAVLTRSRVVAGILGSATLVLTLSVLFGWFPLAWEYQQVADITGLWSVFFRSDMVGYLALGTFLFQRFYVLCWIVAFLALAVWFYPRLKERRGSGWAPYVAAVATVVAVVMGTWWVMDWKNQGWVSEQAAVEQAALADRPPTKVAHYDMELDLSRGRDRLAGKVVMELANDTGEPRTEWVFLLNEGLEVQAVDGAEYDRGLTTLVLRTPPVAPGETRPVTVEYSGKLSPAGLFPSGKFELRDLKARARGNVTFLLGVYPFFVADYAYLPAMADFYPSPNVAYGYEYPDRRHGNWATTRLRVKTPEGWAVATQGRPVEEEADSQVWVSETPIPEVTIYAGPYKVVERKVGDLPVRLYYHPAHQGAVDFFAEAEEPILERAEKKLAQAQDTTGLVYPYPQLNLVEVPLPARVYTDGLDSFAAFHAPGIVAMRENGLFTAHLEKRLEMRVGRSNVQVRVNGQDVTDGPEGSEPSESGAGAEEEEAPAEGGEPVAVAEAADKDVVEPEEAAEPEEGRNVEEIAKEDRIAAKVDMLEDFFKYDFIGGSVSHAVVPSMWDFVLQPEGRLHPLLNRGLAGFVSERATGERRNFSVFAMSDLQNVIGPVFQGVFGGGMDVDDAVVMAGIDQDKAYDLMTTVPLDQLDPAEDAKAYLDVVTLRGHAFFETLEGEIGASKFAEALSRMREQHAYGTYTLADLREAVEDVEGRDMGWLFDAWLEGTDLPGFRLLEVEAFRIQSESPQPRYQILAKAQNCEQVGGYATMEVRFGRGEDSVTRTVRLGPGEAVEWGAIVQKQPSGFRMTPVLAYNRTPSRTSFRDWDWTPKEPEGEGPFEGVREAEYEPWPTGVIVDNGEEGFRIEGRQESFALKLRRWTGRAPADESELAAFNPWGGAGRDWQEWLTEKAYGRYNPNVAVTRSSEGQSQAVWAAPLPSAGQYEVMVYLPGPALMQGLPQRMQNNVKLGTEYRYTIVTADGEESTEFDATRAETGWNSLGTFYFDAGPAEVRLSDDVGSGMVWADAVRFVPESTNRAGLR